MFATTLPPFVSTLSNDPDMRELVELFVMELPQKIGVFESLLEDDNWARLKHVSHQLKGSAGGYGFDCVTPFAARVEQAIEGDHPNLELARSRVLELIEVLRRLRA